MAGISIFRRIKEEVNLKKECQKYHVKLWECPQFLFLIMGSVIILVILATYFIGLRYIEDPLIVALIVIIFTLILLILAYLIVKAFEKVAEASRMKSEFIQIISHQLRTPTANLSWVIDLLFSSSVKLQPEKRKEFLDIIRENVRRMNELVGDLILAARIEKGEIPLNLKEVSLIDLIGKIIVQFDPAIKKKKINLSFSKSENFPAFVKTDPAKLKIIIENLLENAVRFTPEQGKIEVSLSLGKDKKIILAVKDSGIGIPKEEQRFVFKKFYRSRNAREMEPRGSGLGLYIVKNFIERLGGRVYFQSEIGQGTTFFLEMPS